MAHAGAPAGATCTSKSKPQNKDIKHPTAKCRTAQVYIFGAGSRNSRDMNNSRSRRRWLPLCLRVLMRCWVTEHLGRAYSFGAGCRDFLFSVLSLVASSGMQGASRRLAFFRPSEPRARCLRYRTCMSARGFLGFPRGCCGTCTLLRVIDYILVVGHFGLATGSGGKTQSNMHNESCPKHVHSPLTRNGPLNPDWNNPIQLCTMIMTNPQKSCQLDFVFYVLLFFVFSFVLFVCACRSRWGPCMSHEALPGHSCNLPSS